MIKKKILFLGLSTGGPSHIKKLLSSFVKLNSTIIIAQHMKENVLPFFLKDLKESYPYEISGTPSHIQTNSPKVVLCTHTSKILIEEINSIKIVTSKDKSYYTPDINTLFLSATKLCNEYDVCAILLTGIGFDGTDGLKALKEHGAYTIAESEKSAPVFGMPRSAIESDAVQSVKSLDEIIEYLHKE